MVTLLFISRHSPENCPMYNEKVRKVVLERADKWEGLAKRYGIKRIGIWLVPSEHLRVGVVEAPSLEIFQKFRMDPEIARSGSYETAEIKIAISFGEAMKKLKAK